MYIPYLIARNGDTEPIVLVAMHIASRVKEKLRKEAINYFDAAGNLYLKCDSVNIFIDGQMKERFKEEKKIEPSPKPGSE